MAARLLGRIGARGKVLAQGAGRPGTCRGREAEGGGAAPGPPSRPSPSPPAVPARPAASPELESLRPEGERRAPRWRLNRGCLRPEAPGQGAPARGAATAAKRPAVGPVKLRRAPNPGCWEVVKEERPPAAPPGRRHRRRSPGRAEEIDVGDAEPPLPPGAVCARPEPSSESDVDVDVLG